MRYKLAYTFSSKIVKRAVDEMLDRPKRWSVMFDGQFHCVEPYPMGFYPYPNPREPSEKCFYYAQGWGMHEELWPWERWLLVNAAKRSILINSRY